MLQLEKDQHLLKNKEIIKKELEEADIKKEDRIIEIGAGTGNLTFELAKNG
jgi:16S rRNA A1518/A1519 N6-dimethyltransferase RsmA/KsgA/DIM1 with predicted DNA glycosylase/AP lyase activity